jgi:uncharacterized membrane protein YhaH (DUF805 family)
MGNPSAPATGQAQSPQNVVNQYVEVFKKYAVFDGRATRTEFWTFTLGNMVVGVVLAILGGISDGFVVLSYLFSLATFLPSLAVGVRRLHDTGRSGWWWLIGLIPLVGAIVLLVFFVQDSQPGTNEYGPNPKMA